MKKIKILIRISRLIIFAFLFAVCMVMGIMPVIPKRREQYVAEEKINEAENADKAVHLP